MKHLVFVMLMLGMAFTITAQDLIVALTKSDRQLVAVISGDSVSSDSPHLLSKKNANFTIQIKAAFQNAYTVKISNKEGTPNDPLPLIQVAGGNKTITVNNDRTIQGAAAAIPLAGKFAISIKSPTISDTGLTISFNTKKDGTTPSPAATQYNPTGIPIMDALTLANAGLNAYDTIMRIFSFYSSDSITKTNLTTWEAVSDRYKDNKYIQDYVTAFKDLILVTATAQSKESTANILSSALSSVGGLDVTNIADGLAKFLVKRAKEELSTAFFEKFKTEITKYPDLQTVFPQTYKSLMAIDNEIYNFQSYLQTLRESFQKDLSSLPSNLPTIVTNHPDFFNRQPVLTGILNSAFYISQQIQGHQHPGYIIENYPADDIWSQPGVDANVLASFKTLILFSTSLKNNTDTVSYWVPFKNIQPLFTSSNQFLGIYLGLLEQKAKLSGIRFTDAGGTTYPLEVIIEKAHDAVATDLPKYKSFLKNVCLKIQALEAKINALKKVSNNDSLLIENYYNVVSSSIDLMKYMTTAETLPHFPPSLGIHTDVNKYFNIAQLFSDIVVDVNRKNYSSAIVNGVNVYDSIFSKKNLKTYADAITANPPIAPPKDAVVADIAKAAAAATADTISNAKNTFFRYGTFMASMVAAKSSDDVENTIEAFALPAGSARIKRESAFNVSLNGYPGMYYGHEKISGIKDNLAFNSYGVTAPIGVTLSWGHTFLFIPTGDQGWKDGKKGWSTSLFLSLIDLGAIAAYRVNNDSVQQVPTIQLKDIFSPGAFISLGFPKSPLSLNFGAQLGPNLRKVDDSKNDYSGKTYVRFSASLVVDIPVINLFTKPHQ